MSDPKQYKIVELRAEGFKRLSAVTIRPNGNLVQITGKNGEGKSSTLDSIWAAIDGKDACPTVPIRRGEKKAKVCVSLGNNETAELIVTRHFTLEEGGGYETWVTVESPEGARFPTAQRMLDSLLGELTFDPLEFARKKPRDQFDALRRFVPDVDFDDIERKNKKDFDRRTEVNRLGKQERGAAQAILVPDGTPREPIDEDALVAELTRAGATNTDIAERRGNRERALEKVRAWREITAGTQKQIELASEMANSRRNREVARIEEQISSLQQQIQSIRTECDESIVRETARIQREAQDASAHADELEQRLEAAGALPETVDVAAISAKIETARKTNANVRLLDERTKHEQLAEHLETEAKTLTAAIDARNDAKANAIAAASMPVPGIGFGDGHVLLNGLPFEQASQAEQLQASVAIAMALNPRLKVILIRDGSLLDEDSLELIAKMADEHDCQVWIERVDSSGRIGFVIEDGRLKELATEVAEENGAAIAPAEATTDGAGAAA